MRNLLWTALQFMRVFLRIIIQQGGIIGTVTGVLGNPWPVEKSTTGQTSVRDLGPNGAKQGPKEPVHHRLVNIWSMLVPSVPKQTPGWLKKALPLLSWLLYGEDAVVSPADWSTQRPNDPEAWFFLNGIGTTLRNASKTAKRMSTMFGRPITVLHNPTDSMPLDLLECCAGKLWDNWSTIPRELAVKELRKALMQDGKSKVVLICHSQGTIIASNVLRDLHDERKGLTDAQLAKLEVYALANCAHQMEKGKIGRLETLSNTMDTVAMLGSCCPYSKWQDVDGEAINIEGLKFFQHGKRGHFLNAHYLPGLEEGEYAGSKLHKYLVEAKSKSI